MNFTEQTETHILITIDSFLLNRSKALITLYYNLYRAGQWASDVDHSYKTHK